jgi:hypothetical protein
MSADSMKVWLPSLGESTSLLSKLRLKTGEVNMVWAVICGKTESGKKLALPRRICEVREWRLRLRLANQEAPFRRS